jgi:ABC-2 type transport system ATP-binding protein
MEVAPQERRADSAIQLEAVSKAYKIFHRRHSTLKESLLRRSRAIYELRPVLDDIDLTVPQGQSIGIIGRNGAGKSTMLKVIAGLITPDTGTVTVRGRVSTLLELGAGFQGEYSGAENIHLYAALMGLSRRFIEGRVDEILDFAGPEVQRAIDNPIKTYSSGMYMRLAFAVAVHVDPDVLVIDEVLAVGDAAFQRKCFERAVDLRRRGKTIVIVSHDLESIRRFCDRTIWVENGKIVADGNPPKVTERYLEVVDGKIDATGAPAELPVAIESIQLLDASDSPVDAVRGGEGLQVLFKIANARAGSRAQVGVRLINGNGAVVVGSGTESQGPVEMPEGDCQLACRFERLPLAAGHYRIAIKAVDASSGEVLHPVHEAVFVSIIGPPTEGMVMAPSTWEVPARASGSSGAGR